MGVQGKLKASSTNFVTAFLYSKSFNRQFFYGLLQFRRKEMPLLVANAHHKLGKELVRTKVAKKGCPCWVSICEHGMMESTEGHSSNESSFLYEFDIKFSFTTSPLEMKFEKDDNVLTYSLYSQTDLQEWRNALKVKINQRGFHEQFKAIKKIGKGNFATVYLVQKHEDGTKYAVKAFSKEAAYSEEKGKECLIKEIEIMRELTHKNNMSLHEIFETQNSLYIVFELLDGGNLHEKIKLKYKFKPQEIKTIMFGILQGVKEMCEKKIMHRDLKPENLIFRTENSFDCVIADFGLAEFCEADEYLFVRCGTPGYVAPQVINIKDIKTKYHPICDMFSMGIIFHILLFGKSAFPGKTYDEILSQNRACAISLKGEEYMKYGEDALNLLEKMLKKSPKERITAKDAVKHPYFTSEEGGKMEEEIIEEKQTYPSLDSPLLTTGNKNRKIINKKDSCVDFKLGKENAMNGKTDAIGSLAGSKLSGINNFETSVKTPAVSKFARRQ